MEKETRYEEVLALEQVINSIENCEKEGEASLMKTYLHDKLPQMKKMYDRVIEEILSVSYKKIGVEGCSRCDPRHQKLMELDKFAIKDLLNSQLQFKPPMQPLQTGQWFLNRKYSILFDFLATFQNAARFITICKKGKGLPEVGNMQESFRLFRL